MKILVCVKQVPGPDEIRFTAGINRVVREGVSCMTNPLDECALGHALALRAQAGGTIVVATMGPPAARSVLAEALRAGADRALHLVDPLFAGADTLATARALAALVDRERPDLVLLGRGSVDGATSQVPPQLAEFSGLPLVSHAVWVHREGSAVTVVRESERATETWRAELPAIVSVERGPLPARSRTTTGPIEELTADDLGDATGYGIRGSATYVQRVVDTGRVRGRVRISDPAAAADRIDALARTAAEATPSPERRRGRREIWVVAERYRDGLHPLSLEGLAAAHAVAGRLDAAVTGVLACADPGAAPAELGAHGADRVLVVSHPGLDGAGTSHLVAALTGLIGERRPFAVIGPWTVRGRDWLPRVAARLALGLTGDVVGLDTDPNPGDPSRLDLVWLKPAWAGTALARVVARTVPSLGTLRPGAVAPARHRGRGRAVVETAEPDDLTADPRARLLEADDTRAYGLIDDARVVLCVGEQTTPATLHAARSLAAARNWALFGTTGAVTAGLVPPAAELSLRKRSIAPPLVVAVGVIAATDLNAVRGAETIAVIGPSRPAPVHDAADLTVTAEPADVLAALLHRAAQPAGTS